jgi:hypothetical protein
MPLHLGKRGKIYFAHAQILNLELEHINHFVSACHRDFWLLEEMLLRVKYQNTPCHLEFIFSATLCKYIIDNCIPKLCFLKAIILTFSFAG